MYCHTAANASTNRHPPVMASKTDQNLHVCIDLSGNIKKSHKLSEPKSESKDSPFWNYCLLSYNLREESLVDVVPTKTHC